jgi:hypothetical protein
MSTYTIYRADYNPVSTIPTSDPLDVNFDQGNDALTANEIITSNGKYQRIVHRSIDHLYYRDFLNNNKASFGSGNVNDQERWLEDQAYIISVPQSKFGEALMPESIIMSMSYMITPSAGAYYGLATVGGVWAIEDDGLGNLFITGSSFLSPYSEFVGGAFTNFSSSVAKPLVGMWPQDDLYKYVNTSYTNVTQSFTKGLWQMEALYSNVRAIYQTGLNSGLEEVDFLGATWYFTSSISSSIRIKPNEVPENNQK